jgi:hypothetical protein
VANSRNAVDKAGETPLHCAARAGSVDIVRALLDTAPAASATSNPLDLDVQSKKGDTALILACCWGHGAVASMLRQAGADETLTTRNGWDAAKWAAWFRKKGEKEKKEKAKKEKEKKACRPAPQKPDPADPGDGGTGGHPLPPTKKRRSQSPRRTPGPAGDTAAASSHLSTLSLQHK